MKNETLDKYLRFLNYKRPLEPNIIKNIENDLKTNYIYNSNAIEGNTLTFNETKVILEYGVTVKGKPLKDHLEVKGQEYALNYLNDVIKSDEKLNVRLIKEFHQLVMSPSNAEISGRFKRYNNYIGGSKTKTTAPYDVEDKLTKLINNYNNSNESLLEKVAKFHADFEAIHPFEDGNGRTGRLLMNLELMRNGYPITIIKNDDRLDYYNSLEAAQVEHDYSKILDFIEKNIKSSFEMYFKYISNDWVQELESFNDNMENNDEFKEYMKDSLIKDLEDLKYTDDFKMDFTDSYETSRNLMENQGYYSSNTKIEDKEFFKKHSNEIMKILNDCEKMDILPDNLNINKIDENYEVVEIIIKEYTYAQLFDKVYDTLYAELENRGIDTSLISDKVFEVTDESINLINYSLDNKYDEKLLDDFIENNFADTGINTKVIK